MFDLKLQMDAAGVPVPLPGRVLVYVDDLGRLRGRLHDGSLIWLGGSGPQGATKAVYATTVQEMDSTVTASAVKAWVMNATGGGLGVPWSMRFTVAGTQTNGTAASTLHVGLRLNGTVQKAVTVALGTTARTNRPWFAEVNIQQSGAGAVARLVLHVDGVAAPAGAVVWLQTAPDWADWAIEYGFTAAIAGSSATVRTGCVTVSQGIGQ